MRVLVTEEDVSGASQALGHDPIAQCLTRKGFTNVSVYQERGYIIAIDERPQGDGTTKCWTLPQSAAEWLGAWYAGETTGPPPTIYARKKRRGQGER